MQQFDPLDPEHRAERGRERTAFFRQTDMFPLVVITMLVFVPLAMWQALWALPFLGWMAFMTHIVGGVDRLVAALMARPPLLNGSTLKAALVCIALFFVLVVPVFNLCLAGGWRSACHALRLWRLVRSSAVTG